MSNHHSVCCVCGDRHCNAYQCAAVGLPPLPPEPKEIEFREVKRYRVQLADLHGEPQLHDYISPECAFEAAEAIGGLPVTVVTVLERVPA